MSLCIYPSPLYFVSATVLFVRILTSAFNFFLVYNVTDQGAQFLRCTKKNVSVAIIPLQLAGYLNPIHVLFGVSTSY